jgi:hypothetical protein
MVSFLLDQSMVVNPNCADGIPPRDAHQPIPVEIKLRALARACTVCI